MEGLNKAESLIFVCVYVCVLCFQRQPFIFSFYFTVAGVESRVAAVKLLLVLHYRTDYIFISFGIIAPILVTLKIEAGASGSVHGLANCCI